MEEKKIWSMDELVALTDEVQEEEVEYRERMVYFHFCELTEKEEPKFTGINEDLPEDEKPKPKPKPKKYKSSWGNPGGNRR